MTHDIENHIDFRRAFLFVLGIFIVMLPADFANAEEAKRRVIFDYEPTGFPELMLLNSDSVEVLGITTVSGSEWVRRRTAQALRELEMLGRKDVPVAVGATYPLLNSEILTERWEALYGRLLYKGVWMKEFVEPTNQELPPPAKADDPVVLPWGNPTTKPIDETAANFMIRMVRKYPGEVSIIATGPLTNMALAQSLDPEFASLAKELVYVGGSFNPHQVLTNQSASEFAREFETSPRRDFNIRFDPEAASIVSRSPWRKITVVPIDATTATQFDRELFERTRAAAPDQLSDWADTWEDMIGYPLWDFVGIGAWLDPSIIVDKKPLFVDYNTEFGPNYGDTLSWKKHYNPGIGEQIADVVFSVDTKRLNDLIVNSVGQENSKD